MKTEKPKILKYNTSLLAVQYLAEKEGFRKKAYKDIAGVWTIGYGTIEGVKEGDIITHIEAFERKIQHVRKQDKFLNRLIRIDLTQYQYDAISSLVYNIGIGAFSSSTLLKLLNKGDFEGASKQFLRWTKFRNPSNGKLEDSQGLINRRIEEKQIFDVGVTGKFVWKKDLVKNEEKPYEKCFRKIQKFFWWN